MGYRGTFMTNDIAGIHLPQSFVEKYKDAYNIFQFPDGAYGLNITSKFERGSHDAIIADLHELVKGESFEIYACILWEDGKIDRIELTEFKVTVL